MPQLAFVKAQYQAFKTQTVFLKRMLIMFLMSFSSGLPFALTGSTLQLWYAQAGVSIIGLGALTLVGQPYAYKFLWSSLLDRYTPPFLGRRRGWILITQLLLIMGIVIMGCLNPSTHPAWLAAMAVVVAFFSASQDISLDAYRTDLLNPKERGLAAAIWSNGWRIGIIVSGAFALLLADAVGWQLTYFIMAAIMLIAVITTLSAPEPDTLALAPKSFKEATWGAVQEFFTRPFAWGLVLFILLYKLGDAYAQSLTSVFFLKTMGFSLKEIAWVGKTFGLVASIAGVILAGVLMVRWSLYRSLMVFGFLQAFSLLGLVIQLLVGKILWVFASVIFFEHITSGMGTTAFFVLLMALCNKRYTATQYALFSALMVIGRTFVGPVAGFTVEAIGWTAFFLIGFVLAFAGLAVLYYLNKRIDFKALHHN